MTLESPVAGERPNTGTCPVCMERFKLTPARRMVAHGFRITDGFGHYLGYRLNRCLGVDQRPYELSPEGNIEFRKWAESVRLQQTEYLASLRAGEVCILHRYEPRRQRNGQVREKLIAYRKRGRHFRRILADEIAQTEAAINGLGTILERQQFLIDHWERRLLPEEKVSLESTSGTAAR